MVPVTWPEFARLHPFAPADQAQGYARALRASSRRGSPRSPASPRSRSSPTPARRASTRACSRSAPITRAAARRTANVCLIPVSRPRHQPGERGRWPASRSCRWPATSTGNIDLADLRGQGRRSTRTALGALMVTYPSTHGVFEEAIREICAIVHAARRPGLHGRREHERPGRAHPPRRHRRRRLPPEPAQDLLHPARRRRPGHGPDRRGRAPRAVPARPSRSPASAATQSLGHGLRGALRQRQHPPHLLGLHRADGRRRAARRRPRSRS